MFKKFLPVFALLFSLFAIGSAQAQGDPPPLHDAPQWDARYWNNTTLSGTPVVTRQEASLDWNWGTGAPQAGINADGFSARWTRYLDFSAGLYRFTARADDGVRVWVNDTLIINQWHDHPVTAYTGDIDLAAGHHLVTVEYYENTGYAEAHLTWTKVTTPTPVQNWKGEYFNNISLSGSPVLVRDDQTIDFDWKSGSPGSGVSQDNFSVRWSRTLNLTPGNYRFTATADDGVRLWVNDHLLIDQWHDQAATSYTGNIYVGNTANVVMTYYERGGGAVARLSWQKTDGSTPPSPPPSGNAVVVDNGDAGFVRGGAATGWRFVNEGYDNDLTWTKNNKTAQSNYNWARWYPSLNAGKYEVFVFVPFRYTTTSSAHYWVSHRDGYTLRIVDQSATGDQWVSLGTYYFNGTDGDYVSLSDVTGETYLSRLIAWDAMRWEPR